MKLSFLAIALGSAVSLFQVYGLANPSAYAAQLRKFPRSLLWGIVLTLLGAAWFVWNVSQESIADFASYKSILMMAFAGVGVGACVFVQDFLAVRGLAVVLLLLAKLMVDSGRSALPQTSWALVIQFWAYALVIVGMWLTISPWRLRDYFDWATANERRIKLGCSIRLMFGLLVLGLGFGKF